MPPMQPISVAIIGAGFSGTATALNLLDQAASQGIPVKVHLIDLPGTRNRGLAYATGDDNLVLNVPSGNMSVFADRPEDFLEYCHELDSSLNSGSFVYRRLYGEYLQHRVAQSKARHPGQLNEVNDRVIGLRHDQSYTVQLQSGATLDVDRVVLAFGHFAPRRLDEIFRMNSVDTKRCVNNPWDISAVDRLDPDLDVCVIGAGHTAIDTVFRLVSVPAARKIVMVSRHGRLPNGHRRIGEFVKLPDLNKDIEQTVRASLANKPTVRTLMRSLRAMVGQRDNWRDVINALRPITPAIWTALPIAERARFLRHVVAHWDVVRHRLAPVAIRRIEQLIADGKVEIVAARIEAMNASIDAGVNVAWRRRGSNTIETRQFGAIINCSGPNYDIHRVDNPLVRQLAAQGLLQQDAMKIGFEVDEQYRVSQQPHLHYIGPMLKARYWEAIAVPELRQHAAKLAKIILSV